MQDREAAISARAHQLWEESGHAHGQHEQHWRQAEREYDEARLAAVAQLVGEDVVAEPAEPARKQTAEAVEPVVKAPAAPAKKPKAPRKPSSSGKLN